MSDFKTLLFPLVQQCPSKQVLPNNCLITKNKTKTAYMYLQGKGQGLTFCNSYVNYNKGNTDSVSA